MKKVSLLTLAVLMATVTPTFAQKKKSAADQMKDLGLGKATKDIKDMINANTSPTGKVIAEAENIIAFGERLYSILEKGESTMDFTEVEPVNVFPVVSGAAVEGFMLDSWSDTVYKEINASIVKVYGGKVVSKLIFGLAFRANGQYEGKGNFISGLLLFPKETSTGGLLDVDANVSVVAVNNIGTADSPVAEVVLRLQVKARNKLLNMFPGNQTEASFLYRVTGKGEVEELGTTNTLVD